MKADYTDSETFAMPLSIPKAHRSALLILIRLSSAEKRALVQAISDAEPKASLYDFSTQIVNEDAGISQDIAFRFAKFFASLYRYRSELDMRDKEFLEEFILAAQDEVRGLTETDETNWTALRKTIAEILNPSRPLALTAKASELSSEHQRRLCPLNCRILSDARPVFVGDPEEAPTAFLIQHELKIAYHADDGEVKEFYVAMDSDDLLHLQSLLWRAEQKEKSIRTIVKKTGIRVLGDEGAE